MALRLTVKDLTELERRGRLPKGTVAGLLGAAIDVTPPRQSGGKRASLGGLYVRSSWEASFAHWLRYRHARGEIWGWAYEPVEFWFHEIRRGTRTYLPDFLTWDRTGWAWSEIKGFNDPKSKTRLKRFKLYYPDEYARLTVYDHNWFHRMIRSGLAGAIPGWEFAHPLTIARGATRHG